MAGTNWITARDRSRHDMDRNQMWMDDRRWMRGDESQEMDHGRRMTINPHPFYDDIEVMQSYTILKITTLISNYEVSKEHRYA
jgi:hypothetical protein